MGVIQRQAAKRSIASYIAAGIGVFSQMWIYPLVYGINGNIQSIISMVSIMLPFASLGIIGLTVRFFPKFKTSDGTNNGFLGVLILFSTISFILFALFFLFFKDTFYLSLEAIKFDVQFFRSFSNIIIGCILLAIYNSILLSYASNLNRIVVPFIISNLTMKIIIPILCILYLYFEVRTRVIYESIFWIYLFISIAHSLYLISLKGYNIRPRFSSALKENWQSMGYYAIYGVVASMGSILAFNIDIIMLRGWTTDEISGIYVTMTFLAGMVIYPYKSVAAISAPQIAQAWKDFDLKSIESLYKKASNVLILPTLMVGFMIVLNFIDVTWISSNPADMQLGVYALFVLVVARSLDSIFGLNGAIIAFSKYYFFNFIATLVLAFCTVYLNYVFIEIYEWGMIGAAISTCIAYVVFNIAKFLFIWIVWGMQPFRLHSLWIILILAFGGAVCYSIPFGIHPIVNIALRSLLFTALTIPLIYRLNLSPEMNKFTLDVWNKGMRMVRKRRN